MPFRRCLLLSFLLSACVTYHDAPADPATVDASLQARAGGAFTFAAAVGHAFAHQPGLTALTYRARAASLTTVPTETEAEWRSDTEMLAVLVDPVALLGLGPRGGELGLRTAEAQLAAQELAVARWRTLTAIAEGFAVDRALQELAAPTIPLAPAPFAAAGLAAPTTLATLTAVSARAAAEGTELATARAQNLAALRELLGLPAAAELTLEHGPDDQPPAPTNRRASLLQRPDLALATARFEVADAEFRAAVAAQYPSLMLGPDIPLRGDPLQLMAVLRLPLGAAGPARAAEQRREAVRAELAAALLAADREALEAELGATAAAATAAATATTLAASQQTLRARLAATDLDPEPDTFERAVDAAAMVVRDTMEHRLATVAQARATVRAATAAGWPGTEPRQ